MKLLDASIRKAVDSLSQTKIGTLGSHVGRNILSSVSQIKPLVPLLAECRDTFVSLPCIRDDAEDLGDYDIWDQKILLLVSKPDKDAFVPIRAPSDRDDFRRIIGELTGRSIQPTDKDVRVDIVQLKEIARLANCIASPHNLRFLGKDMFFYLMMMAAYVVKRDGNATYMDLVEILGGDKVRGISKIYTHDEDCKRVRIGILSKLLGLEPFEKKKMDCPRVWDLVEDKIVSNPNLYLTKEFVDKEGYHPIVAITHRWGRDEITYEKILRKEQANEIFKSDGKEHEEIQVSNMSDKLRNIREDLRGDYIRYVWMDTLCIDKTNSVELDEGIRSMYRWYSEAWYVYLENGTELEDWATRGWTLQEGAAATILRTNPRHGSFMEILSKLRWDDQKMLGLALGVTGARNDSAYWINLMDSRETTKVEDKAYALVGLLGVDFQSAYGEGERAMSRLREELVKQRGDISWLIGNGFRNGNWKSEGKDQSRHKLYGLELSSRKNMSTSHEDIYLMGHTLKVDAVKLEAYHRRSLFEMPIGDGIIYKSTLRMADDCWKELCKNKIETGYWWVPSNNIVLYLCRYNTKDNVKKLWRIICVRGVLDGWKPPTQRFVSLDIDYNTVVYDSDFRQDLKPDGSRRTISTKPDRGNIFMNCSGPSESSPIDETDADKGTDADDHGEEANTKGTDTEETDDDGKEP